jgi:hypothetical protein
LRTFGTTHCDAPCGTSVPTDLTSIGHKEGDSEVRRALAAAAASASFKVVGTT